MGKLSLIVTVLAARRLMGTDMISGKSDPYVVLRLGKQKKKTKKKKKNLNPTFNESFTFEVKDPLSEVLKVEVFDHDFFSSDDPLGHCEVHLKDLYREIDNRAWYNLVRGNQGQISLSLHTKNFGLDPSKRTESAQPQNRPQSLPQPQNRPQSLPQPQRPQFVPQSAQPVQRQPVQSAPQSRPQSLPHPHQYHPPQPQYGQPNYAPHPSYGYQSQPHYRPQSMQYGVPQPQYGMPQPQCGMPQPQYGMPQPQYGMPQPQYGMPQPQYGIPQQQRPKSTQLPSSLPPPI